MQTPIPLLLCAGCLAIWLSVRDGLEHVDGRWRVATRPAYGRRPCRGCGTRRTLDVPEVPLCDECLAQAYRHGIWSVYDDPTVPPGHWRCSFCGEAQRTEQAFSYSYHGRLGSCGRCTTWGGY